MYGGAIYGINDYSILTNCIFIGNHAKIGGAIYNQNNSYHKIINCTFTANKAINEGGGIYHNGELSDIYNCIFWNNCSPLGPQICMGDAMINLSYCCVQGGEQAIYKKYSPIVNWGESNIDTDPLLTPDGHLTHFSPLINLGDPNFIYDPEWLFDIDVEGRITDNHTDIGADEFLDGDRDKLPDWWEIKYFGDSFIAEPYHDSDGDTLTNIEEYELYSSDPSMSPLFVNGGNINDPIKDGTSNHPFASIQAGIDAAMDGDTVLVAAGIYTGENNKDLDFHGKSIVLKAHDGPENTIIDCRYSGRGFYFHSGETQSAALIGFSIVNGLAVYGGAILCERSNPQIIECVVSNNTATKQGSSIYFSNATPVLADCIITNNGPESVWMESSSVRIDGIVALFDRNLYGKDLMLTGLGAIIVNPNTILDLNNVRIRCNITGPGKIQVDFDSELLIEKDAMIDLGDETDPQLNGQIICDGLLRLKDNAGLINAYVDISRIDVGNNTIIANCIIRAEAGVPYGQFYLEDNVFLDIPLIEADGDRYLDLDPIRFDVNNVHVDAIDILITEGVGGSYGGLFELRGRDMGLYPCKPGEFFCRVDSIPDFAPDTWTINRLELVAGAKLNLTNRYDFQDPYDSGGEYEVLYVKDLILGKNSILNTAFNHLYYENLVMDPSAKIVNIPLLGFSLNNITFDDEIDYTTRVKNNNLNDPNPNLTRIHIERITGIEPDPAGMVRMQNLEDLDPTSPSYEQPINARAKGLFSKAIEDRILVMFEYLFETSEPGTELVIYLSDVPELLSHSGPGRIDHYIEVARIAAPPVDRPGSAGSGRFGVFHEFVYRGHLNFIRGTRIELELIGPEGASVLINNWDPQVHCSGICMDLNWSDAPDEEDLMVVIGEYGNTAELLPDATNSRACLDGVFSTDGYVDSFDVVSWDWVLSESGRADMLNLCQVPISMGLATMATMSVSNAWLESITEPIALIDLTNSLSDLLIVGKRNMSEDPRAYKSKDRLYLIDRTGQYVGWSELTSDRGNIRVTKDPEGKLYQINSDIGIVKLDNSGEVIVPSGQTAYDNEPRYNTFATIYIGVQNRDISPCGRPILDAAFDEDYVYVVPVVVSPNGEDAYLAAAKLQLLEGQNPPYQVVQLYDDPPAANDNQHRNHLREIEIDGSGNVYVINTHSLNESDILWKYGPDGTPLIRVDLGNLNSSSYLPDPIAMRVSGVTNMVYITSGQKNLDLDSKSIYCFSKDQMVLENIIEINGMQHVTDITEDPAGTLWIVGFNMIEDIPDYPDPTQLPFYYPTLAKVASGGNSVEVTDLLGSSDLALPMSILWTGDN
jgi:hypothetical protein